MCDWLTHCLSVTAMLLPLPAHSFGFVVAGSPSLSRSSGKFCFEVEVLKADGEVHVGFAGTNFRADYVGADEASWGVSSKHGWPQHK